ncbi:hypothetical protein B6D52_02395 [Candidatus Parcubacteria bacterium 4484_255]|nr:MAG: hypothetical protein B6D52_02395 [Candidatus Parcubacteria bacterium 4484_255]
MLSPIKSIVLFFFIFLLVVLQMSWPLFPRQLSLIFILVTVLFLTGFSSWAWFAAIIGGLFLDLYSVFPPGLFCLSLVCYLAIFNKIVSRFNITSTQGFFILGLGSAFIYKVNILLFSYLYHLLKFSDYCIILNKFYWFDLIWFMILNVSFVFVIALGVKMIRKKAH